MIRDIAQAAGMVLMMIVCAVVVGLLLVFVVTPMLVVVGFFFAAILVVILALVVVERARPGTLSRWKVARNMTMRTKQTIHAGRPGNQGERPHHSATRPTED